MEEIYLLFGKRVEPLLGSSFQCRSREKESPRAERLHRYREQQLGSDHPSVSWTHFELSGKIISSHGRFGCNVRLLRALNSWCIWDHGAGSMGHLILKVNSVILLITIGLNKFIKNLLVAYTSINCYWLNEMSLFNFSEIFYQESLRFESRRIKDRPAIIQLNLGTCFSMDSNRLLNQWTKQKLLENPMNKLIRLFERRDWNWFIFINWSRIVQNFRIK